MKASELKQLEVISNENNQNETELRKIKLKEVLLPVSSCVKFLAFCKKTAKKKLEGFNKSGK